MTDPGVTPGVKEVAHRWATTLGNLQEGATPSHQLEGVLLDVIKEALAAAQTNESVSSSRFAALYAACPIGIALTDPTGVVVSTNAAFNDFLGLPGEHLIGRAVRDLLAEARDVFALEQAMTELVEANSGRFQRHVAFRRTESSPIWADVTITLLPGDTPGTVYPMLLVRDVNEVQVLQETLRHQNTHDPLTGLPNSSQLAAKLDAIVGAHADEQIALIYVDLDGFKVINNGLGPSQADLVLRGVASKLSHIFSVHSVPNVHDVHSEHGVRDGFVARLAGDGFAVVLRGDLRAPDVIGLVERALRELADPISVAGKGVGVSASVGIIVRPVHGAVRTEVQRCTEIALHRAKESGKAQWVLYNPELEAHDRSRYQLGATIAGALAGGEFSLIYQPTVKLADPTQLAAVNAGLRWNHPEFGQLDSDQFYPLAETTGMTIPLGRWLLANSLAATARWQTKFGTSAPDVCVRLPNRLAIEADLVLLVKEELDRNQLSARALRLCVDGASILDPRGEVLDSLAVLADLGAQMVLAVSNSADLEMIPHLRLAVNHIILSGRVVDALAEEDDDTAVRHISQLINRAQELKLRIGAEGVRNYRQAARLHRLGVIAARGPFVSASATGDEVDQLIERHAR